MNNQLDPVQDSAAESHLEPPISLEKPVALMRRLNHDLRNPLNAVLATANMLHEGIYDPLSPGQMRAVQRIERNTHRILALLDSVIGYVKAESGELQLTTKEFEPRRLLEDIRIECQSTAESKQITLSISTTDSVPQTLHGDEPVIRRIILELVWNALSFTPEGCVWVSSAWSDGWQITVKDMGGGVPANAVPHLFEPFWSGDVAGSAVPTSGSGLGLAAAQAFAKLMKGQVTLKESSPDGSVFEVRLPLS